MSELTDLLAGAPGTPVAMICVDGLGSSYAANLACYEALRRASASSASLMVPAPWSRGAASGYRGEDVGVELTLNSPLEIYRWGPITHAPSLLDGDGGFPRTIDDLWEHADLDEVRREWRAQIERAIYWGFDVSHVCAFLPGVESKPEFFDVYLELAEEFRLPARLAAADEERRVGFPLRKLAAEAGVLAADRSVFVEVDEGGAALLEAIETLPDDLVTELVVRPAADTPELRAAEPGFAAAVAAAQALARPETLAALARVRLVGYRELRTLMR